MHAPRASWAVREHAAYTGTADAHHVTPAAKLSVKARRPATPVADMDGPETAPGVRVRAATELLAKLVTIRELSQLEKRLEALEQARAARGYAQG